MMFRFESTQVIYDFITSIETIFIDNKLISKKFPQIDKSKIDKALSDLNKDKIIIRIARGSYINISGAGRIEKITNSRSIKTSSNLLKELLLEQLYDNNYEVKKRLNVIRIFKSPLQLSFENHLTNQTTNRKYIVVDLGLNNVGDITANTFTSILNCFMKEKNSEMDLFQVKNRKDMFKLFSSFIKASNILDFEVVKVLFEKEYGKFIRIVKNENAHINPNAILKILFKELDFDKFNSISELTNNEYILEFERSRFF